MPREARVALVLAAVSIVMALAADWAILHLAQESNR
jgi:hypothetical protein